MSASLKPLHNAFTRDYKERIGSIKTTCRISNPFTANFYEGQAIWDTGATRTVVSPKLVQKLNLIATGRAEVRGVNSRQVVNKYIIGITLPNKLDTRLGALESDIGDKIDILLGMDVIGIGDFSICNGRVFSFCTPPFIESPIDFVKKADEVNSSIDKKLKSPKQS
ncbi:MAG: retropepsin-like aspartic protease [Halobacteriovoraceae bacterium]|nr:retropepsin-like aspartic protease [Halobacteriovoraceae bacterium]